MPIFFQKTKWSSFFHAILGHGEYFSANHEWTFVVVCKQNDLCKTCHFATAQCIFILKALLWLCLGIKFICVIMMKNQSSTLILQRNLGMGFIDLCHNHISFQIILYRLARCLSLLEVAWPSLLEVAVF